MTIVVAPTSAGRVHLADGMTGLTWCGARIAGPAHREEMSDCRDCLLRYKAGRR